MIMVPIPSLSKPVTERAMRRMLTTTRRNNISLLACRNVIRRV